MKTGTSKVSSPNTGDQEDATNRSDDRVRESLANDERGTGEEKEEPAWLDDEFKKDFELAKTRDEDGTDRLLTRLGKPILAACVKQLRDVYPRKQRLEDLAQEVRFQAWQGLPDCDAKSEKQLWKWIRQIAHNKHIDDVRPAMNKDSNFVGLELLAERSESANQYDEARFAQWRDRLSDREKLIVRLRWEEQLPYEKIGKKLPSEQSERPRGNSRSQVCREYYAALGKLELTCPLPKDTVKPRRRRREKYVKRKRKEKHGPEQ